MTRDEALKINEAAVDYADGAFPEHAGFSVNLRLAAIAGYCNGFKAALTAAPQGWRLVPVEATGAMLNAACRTPILRVGDKGKDYIAGTSADAVYSAMLAAAPAAPRGKGEG